MTTVPLTVLASEGPLLRAYLAMMRRAGMMPARILLMVLKRHPVTRRPIGRWLPGRIRTWYAEKGQDCLQNHWPRRIRASYPSLLESIAAGMRPLVDDASGVIAEMLGRFPYETYAKQVQRLVVDGLRDVLLERSLSKMAPGAVLFTGGGLLPERLIDLKGLRFLHVHPGLLPNVRGADGILWSTLLRGCPGTSCFYMARGIDTGRIVAVKEYPPLRFALNGQPRPDDQTLYRAVFSFCDPLLRAAFWVRNVFGAGPDLSELPASEQDSSQGITYHFMHGALRRRVLQHLFVGGECEGD